MSNYQAQYKTRTGFGNLTDCGRILRAGREAERRKTNREKHFASNRQVPEVAINEGRFMIKSVVYY